MPEASSMREQNCPLLHLDEVDSTNAEALRLALAGTPGPMWILADRQTVGRGRSGRRWESFAGNYHGSLLLGLRCAPGVAAQLALVAGVAVIEAIAAALPAVAQQGLRLKWPNDVLVGGGKVGGILIETTTAPRHPGLLAVVGIGINLVAHPALPDHSAAHLSSFGPCPSPRDMHDHVDAALARWLARWGEGMGFAEVREEWMARAGSRGEPLSVHVGGEVVTGAYAGLDPDGSLLLETANGTRRRIAFGDVTVLAGLPPAKQA